MITQETLLKVQEVMSLLRVNRKVPYAWHKSGVLKAVVLPSGALRWRQSDLDKFINKPGGAA